MIFRKKNPGPYRFPLPTGAHLACVVCGNEYFEAKFYKLNTTGMEALGMAAWNDSATCMVCTGCRYIHWFDL